MKKSSKATVHPLDQFSHYVSGAIKSFFELLRTWRQAPALPVAAVPGAAAKPTARPGKAVEPMVKLVKSAKGLHQPSGQFPWDQILRIARRLLAKNPQRFWKIGELCHAVKAAGANVVSATGMHFGLMPRLKAEGLIVTSGKTFKFKAGPEGVSVSRGKMAEKVVAKKTTAKVEKKVAAQKGAKKIVTTKAAEKKTAKAPKKVADKKTLSVNAQLLAACEKLLASRSKD